MIHPHTELGYVNKSIGYGVFATKFIPKGTIVWVLDELDQQFEESYILSIDPIRRRQVIKYSYRNKDGKYILCWDLAKFINHSFHANCITTAYEFEVAIRDIYPGEELTDDYGYLNLDEPFYCCQESDTYRTVVMPDDILYFYAEWDAKVTEAINYFNLVDQPLKYLMNPQYIDTLNAVLTGTATMDSILHCYYQRHRIFESYTQRLNKHKFCKKK